jgi:hypothetical protein
MPNPALFQRPFFLGFLGLAIGVVVVSSPAWAGFQWVPPAESGTQMQEPSQPVIIQAPPAAPAPSVVVPSAPVTRAPQTLQLPQESAVKPEIQTLSGKPASEEHVLVAPSSGAASKADSGEDKPVRGFANNVPLAVALRQILPPEYGFSVGQNVKLSVLVSWQGGHPWRWTLNEMLRSAGLAMREQGKMINIVSASGGAEAASVTPTPFLQSAEENKPISLAPSTAAAPVMQAAPVAAAPSVVFRDLPPSQASTVDTWTANQGETLHKVLEKWCHRAGVDLNWQAEYDYPVQASVTLTGTFEESVRTLLTGFEGAQPQPIASLHNSPAAGASVLIVQVRGNNYND